jgi:hypothetical protein
MRGRTGGREQGKIKEEKLENKREEGKNREGRRGIEPKIIGGTKKENPAHRGRKAGEFGGKTKKTQATQIAKIQTQIRKKRPAPRKRKPHIIPALLSSPERNQSEQKKTKKTSRKEKDHPESTNTVIGFPFYSASFHSQREKLKRRGMSC